jgi:hypothetical protein
VCKTSAFFWRVDDGRVVSVIFAFSGHIQVV